MIEREMRRVAVCPGTPNFVKRSPLDTQERQNHKVVCKKHVCFEVHIYISVFVTKVWRLRALLSNFFCVGKALKLKLKK